MVHNNSKFGSINREIETFFEKASSQGKMGVAKLTVKERAEYAQKGAFLEDEIYIVRDKLMELEENIINGVIQMDEEVKAELTNLRDELNGLKDDYIKLVGAGDLPLYFGNEGTPDAMQ